MSLYFKLVIQLQISDKRSLQVKGYMVGLI